MNKAISSNSPRRRGREYAVQALYQKQLNRQASNHEIASHLRQTFQDDARQRTDDLRRTLQRFEAQEAQDVARLEKFSAKTHKKIERIEEDTLIINELFTALFFGVCQNETHYLQLISPLLDMPESELNPVERALLLVACHELVAMKETPFAVIINEAVEMTKKYGGTDSYRFINGVLDRLAAHLRPHDKRKN